MNNDIEQKIDEITSLTKSQQDRLTFKDQVSDNLITFLQSFIKKIETKNNLASMLENDLADKINPMIPADGSEPDGLSNYEKIKLLEVLKKSETDSDVALIKAIFESQKNTDSGKKKLENEESEHKKASNDLTQKDINDAISVLNTLKKITNAIEKTELSQDELLKKII